MHFPVKLITLLTIAVMGCSGSAEKSSSGTSKSGDPSKISAGSKFVPVDLQSHANVKLARGEKNDLTSVPTEAQRFDGVEFYVGPKLLQLSSRSFPRHDRQITGIPVGRAFRVLHFLHSTQGGAFQRQGNRMHENDGVNVGHYSIHYSDGSTENCPIIYGETLRGWWSWDKFQSTKNATVAWKGTNVEADKYGLNIRLYRTMLPGRTRTPIRPSRQSISSLRSPRPRRFALR